MIFVQLEYDLVWFLHQNIWHLGYFNWTSTINEWATMSYKRSWKFIFDNINVKPKPQWVEWYLLIGVSHFSNLCVMTLAMWTELSQATREYADLDDNFLWDDENKRDLGCEICKLFLALNYNQKELQYENNNTFPMTWSSMTVCHDSNYLAHCILLINFLQ